MEDSGGGGRAYKEAGANLTAAGSFYAGGVEFSNVRNGMWQTQQGLWKSINPGYFGNQYDGSRLAVESAAAKAHLFGLGLGLASSALSLYVSYDAYESHDMQKAAVSLDDSIVGTTSLFGGMPGWALGGGYFLMRTTGLDELAGSAIATGALDLFGPCAVGCKP